MNFKKFFGFLLCLLAVVLFGATQVKAVAPSSQIVENVSTQVLNLPEGVEFHIRKDKTAQNGDITAAKRDQNVQAIVVPKAAETVELVVWAAGDDHKWGRATLRSSIVDFERRNPGYRVIAGVNGDFFDISDTFQPSSAHVSAGDVWKKDNRPYKTLGIFPDKSYIIGQMTTNNYLSLKTVEGRIVTSEFKIDVENKLPTGNEVALFFPGSAQKLNVTGYNVYKGNYDIYRVSKDMGYVTPKPLGKFLKGEIVEKSSTITQIDNISLGEFYVISKNPDLDAKLEVGTSVKAEHSLTGDWVGVENAIGLNHDLLRNGQILEQSNKDVHPRTLIGMRADGTFVLMTVDGRQPLKDAHGVTYIESGALLAEMGCVEGYNLDGGGSTTSIIRNEQGQLEVMNMPSDGGERSLGNTILVVMREHNIEATNVSTRGFNIEHTAPIVNGTIQNLRVKLDGGEFQTAVDNKVVFDGLKKDTTYNVYYTYEILDESGRVLKSPVNTMRVSTLGAGVPELRNFRITKATGDSVTLRYRIDTDDETEIIKYYIQYGDKAYDLDELNATVTIGGLEAETEYEFKLVVEYRYQGQDRVLTSETLTQTTGQSSGGSGGGGCGGSATALYLGLVSVVASGAFVVLKRKH
ncbi:MAG: phosphodiester glycosidase family protein [Bacilli bacterium]